MVPESNDDMTQSYLMVSPYGEFYQNSESNEYVYSEKIIDQGVSSALDQVGFDYSKYVRRGGKYEL